MNCGAEYWERLAGEDCCYHVIIPTVLANYVVIVADKEKAKEERSLYCIGCGVFCIDKMVINCIRIVITKNYTVEISMCMQCDSCAQARGYLHRLSAEREIFELLLERVHYAARNLQHEAAAESNHAYVDSVIAAIEEKRDKIMRDFGKTRKFCGACNAEKPRKICSCCRYVYYCNDACSRAHWYRQHKKECKAIANISILYPLVVLKE